MNKLTIALKLFISNTQAVFKSSRTVLMLRGECKNFDAICAFVCMQQEIGMFVMNEIGNTTWESMKTDEDKFGCFKQRLKRCINKFHPVTKNISEFSPEKGIRVFDL